MAESSSPPLKRSRPRRSLKLSASSESESDNIMDVLIEGDDVEPVEYKSSDSGGQFSGEEEEDASLTMTVTDVDVLDCPICFSPLTVPVYQCANGHTACSNCFPKLRDVCPSCSEKLGKIRCRAIERIIESSEIPCAYERYGCSFKLRYINRHLHEDQCSCAPFGCPFERCNFRGSLRKVSLHINQKHRDSVAGFRFGSSFSVSLYHLHGNPHCAVLEEERERRLFILVCENDRVKIWCFGSPSRYAYALMAKQWRNSQWFLSTTEKAVGMIRDPPSASFLQIPDYFSGGFCSVELNACIWDKKYASDEDICSFVCESRLVG